MLSSARSWDEELIIAHRRMATGTLVKWPANQGNDMVQLVRRQYTLSMGRLLFHSDSYDNGESLLVQSAQQRSRLTATLSKNLTPRNFGFPDDVHAILRLTHLQHLDDHLPAAQARPKARL